MPLLALDDRDAAIVYSTGWTQAGTVEEFNSTTTGSVTIGATAEVTFFGTGVTVLGTIGGNLLRRPTSSYSIDGGTAVAFAGSPTLTTQYNQVFFRSPALPLANHTLLITNTGDDGTTFLDLILVVPPDGPLTTTVTTTLTPTPVTTARTVTVTSTAQAAAGGTAGGSSNTDTTSAAKSSNAGAIAGGVIGGIALTALLIFGAIYLLRRQRRKDDSADNIAAFWNTRSPGGTALPTPPLAPQFQSHGGQTPMVQNNNTGGYGSSASYEPWQGYAQPQGPSQSFGGGAGGGGYPPAVVPIPPRSQTYSPVAPAASSQSYSNSPRQPTRTYALPSQMNTTQQGDPSDLAYYSSPNDAYGGYSDPGPYPPPSTHQATGSSGHAGQYGQGPSGNGSGTGRIRVNLD